MGTPPGIIPSSELKPASRQHLDYVRHGIASRRRAMNKTNLDHWKECLDAETFAALVSSIDCMANEGLCPIEPTCRRNNTEIGCKKLLKAWATAPLVKNTYSHDEFRTTFTSSSQEIQTKIAEQGIKALFTVEE